MANEMVGWDGLIGFMKYGERWRHSRRAFHQNFTTKAVVQYYPNVTKGSRSLLVRLSREPTNFMDHLRHMSGELIMRIVYGIDVQSEHDPYISLAETALQSLVTGNAGTYLVKHIPKWFPGASFKRHALSWRNDVLAMMDRPFAAVKQALAEGEAQPSILSGQLHKLDETRDNSYEESIFRSAAASAYVGASEMLLGEIFSDRPGLLCCREGGADTTVSSLGTFILAMLAYPEVQKKAQAELDSVIGRSRLPEFSDEEALPYISAVVKEVFRWQPVTPLAVPHRLITDDEYMGYYLPAGTLVVGNTWAMLHDEDKYPQPERFYPERYLREDGTLNPAAPDPAEAAFGFGRRICPGRHLARASVWMSVASVLATFDIQKAVDEAGNAIEPRIEYTAGLISYPVPFKCAFKLRFAETEKLIRLGEDA
ncbi:hypothetical protein EIP86_000915 [Pleurotus ostreatoroseus]|nr:hypothetical protein EIP86_000915 [Pleurotus ostreatoroseus]